MKLKTIQMKDKSNDLFFFLYKKYVKIYMGDGLWLRLQY